MVRSKTDFTNIKCCICEKGNLTSKTAIKGECVSERFRWKWICKNCYLKDYHKRHNCGNNIIKSLRNRRTGNIDPNSPQAKGDLFQELTCRWRSTISTIPVEDLNKKYNNYRSSIDHSRDSELGIIQTKGKLYDSYNRYWVFGNLKLEWDKEFDYEICYCTSKDGTLIERIYIFPKMEIIKRSSIAITKNPTDSYRNPTIPWYEKYRIKDEDTIKKVNDIWKDIIKVENK